MRVLIACEESQEVCKAFRARGHEAFSCDLLPCSGGHPEWHIIGDCLKIISGRCNFQTQNGDWHYVDKWDFLGAHPPCTYLTCSAEWAYKDGPYHQKVKLGTLVGEARREARREALKFVKQIFDVDVYKRYLENPVGVISVMLNVRPQIIQPYMFGEDASKATCLYLRGLPPLTSTQIVQPRLVNGKRRWGNQTDGGQNKLPPSVNRAALRSKTYPGIAKAISEQWG